MAKFIVDGSTVLHAGQKEPRVENLRLMIDELKQKGCEFEVYVDASKKHEVDDPEALKQMISEGMIKQVPKGTPADLWILKRASELPECKIISTDTYSDWEEKFPFVRELGKLLPFMIAENCVMFETDLPFNNKKAENIEEELKNMSQQIQNLESEIEDLKNMSQQNLETKITEKAKHIITNPILAIVVFVMGLAVTWFSILAFALLLILRDMPAEVQKFVPRFAIFIIVAMLGTVLSRAGEACPRLANKLFACSGLAIILTTVGVLYMWGGDFVVRDPTFWFRMVSIGSIAWLGIWSLKKSGIIP